MLIHETLKKMLSNAVFYFLSIGLGLAFTVLFSYFNPGTAAWISVLVFVCAIACSLLAAFFLTARQDAILLASYLNEMGKHRHALNILKKARKKAANQEEYRRRIDYEMAAVYYSMEEYRQTVNLLNGILEEGDTKWTWKMYFLLAKAYCHTEGFYSEEALDAYLRCAAYRKTYEEYGGADIKPDIELCHEIAGIYRVKKDAAEANRWFREEMTLRDARCDIGIKHKIRDLMAEAAALASENRAEDALRKYEESAYLIEKNIGTDSDKFAMVQLAMGRLFLQGYAVLRYDLATECFQNYIRIKRQYMPDLPKELSDFFSRMLPDLKEACWRGIVGIAGLFQKFMTIRSSSDVHDQRLTDARDAVIGKCEALLPIFEEVFPADSTELAEAYRMIGEAYKWCPTSLNDCRSSLIYLEKVKKIWEKYTQNRSIRIKLAHLLVDLGGTYVMQNDYERALPYRLEAFRTICETKDPDLETAGKVEVALWKVYGKTEQSRIMSYERFLEENSLSPVIERIREQPLENGWCDVYVTLRGREETCVWRMTQ
ncbi:MAG: hypothetical protein HFI35_13405 [Roseburia sp.]|jgi:tetratricopeptide (TPR) repeat protein|nr:hypothetical protein [Roseburia sp.]